MKMFTNFLRRAKRSFSYPSFIFAVFRRDFGSNFRENRTFPTSHLTERSPSLAKTEGGDSKYKRVGDCGLKRGVGGRGGVGGGGGCESPVKFKTPG